MRWPVLFCFSVVFASISNNEYQDNNKRSFKKKFRPRYHISSLTGWMSSPAGFVHYQEKYHIFYQYNPQRQVLGGTHWGHAVSVNLIDWVHYPPALMPTEYYEQQGCLSGTAVVHNRYINLIYTGNVLLKNRTYHTQNIASSIDGLEFQKYLNNPIIKYNKTSTSALRNPRVWRNQDKWYMFLGSSIANKWGCLDLYVSKDMFNWEFQSTVAVSYGDMGYLWENPDFFNMDGYQILMLSVRGIQPVGYRFRNLYQTGYIFCSLNYGYGRFDDTEVSTTTFHELDHGHDFYATQTTMSPCGRRLLIGWLGSWDNDTSVVGNNLIGIMTIVRELSLSSDGTLLMNPVTEAASLRKDILEDAIYHPGEAFLAGTKSFELVVTAPPIITGEVIISLKWARWRHYTITYNAEQGSVSVDRGGLDGVRKTKWHPESELHFRIFVDVSSVEVFCGSGEVVFSSRIFPTKGIVINIEGNISVHLTLYKLRKSVGYDIALYETIIHNARKLDKKIITDEDINKLSV